MDGIVKTPMGEQPWEQAIKWHLPTILRWIAESGDRTGYAPSGDLIGEILKSAAGTIETFGEPAQATIRDLEAQLAVLREALDRLAMWPDGASEELKRRLIDEAVEYITTHRPYANSFVIARAALSSAPVTVEQSVKDITPWVSEGVGLPNIGQQVLLATPDDYGEFWHVTVAALLARHEDVIPIPIAVGDEWTTEYYWGDKRNPRNTMLLSGKRFWAPFTVLPLPPGASHKNIRGYDVIVQEDAATVCIGEGHD